MQIIRFQFMLFGINTYVVYDEKSLFAAIIDPGMSSHKEEKIIADYISEHGLKIKHLINTHLHIDHAIGNAFVCNNYGVVSEAHKADERLGSRLSVQAELFGLPFSPDSVEIGKSLVDGDLISVGESSLQVLHVPGHSKGSIALYCPESHFLISGDALFAGSIGRTDLPGGSANQLITSIREKILTLPSDTIVYPGHGDYTTVGNEIRMNPFLQ